MELLLPIRRVPGHTVGEDGLAGVSRMTSSTSALPRRFGMARTPFLKERLFGLTNSEGNHGEDVKEYYFYLDSTDPFVHEVPVQVSAGSLSL